MCVHAFSECPNTWTDLIRSSGTAYRLQARSSSRLEIYLHALETAVRGRGGGAEGKGLAQLAVIIRFCYLGSWDLTLSGPANTIPNPCVPVT